jgi:hypothetical protein
MAGLDLSGISVAIMMNARDPKDTTVPTQNSLIATIMLLHNYKIKFEWLCNTGGDLCYARNLMAEKLLRSKHDRAFLIDSDLQWKPDDFLRILAFSLRYEVILVSYLAKTDKKFWLAHIDPAGAVPDEYGCIPVLSAGLGFACVQRKAFEELSAKAPLYRHVKHREPFPEVFRFDKVTPPDDPVPDYRGEDAAFLADVRDAGMRTMMDPSIELVHWGMKGFTGRFADVLTPAKAAA